MIQYINNPFELAEKAFEDLYPGHTVYLQITRECRDENDNTANGTCQHMANKTALVTLNAMLSLEEGTSTLIHELSHVAVGETEEEHPVEFWDVCKKINDRVKELMIESFDCHSVLLDEMEEND